MYNETYPECNPTLPKVCIKVAFYSLSLDDISWSNSLLLWILNFAWISIIMYQIYILRTYECLHVHMNLYINKGVLWLFLCPCLYLTLSKKRKHQDTSFYKTRWPRVKSSVQRLQLGPENIIWSTVLYQLGVFKHIYWPSLQFSQSTIGIVKVWFCLALCSSQY